MIETIFKSAFVRRRMASSHLGIILAAFIADLKERGHAMTCIQAYGQVAEHFSRWLGTQQFALSQIDESMVERFVRGHLPRCSCPRPAPKHARNCRAALGRLLAFLRQQGLLGIRSPNGHSVIDDLLMEYDRHLREVAGVVPSTRQYRAATRVSFCRHVCAAADCDGGRWESAICSARFRSGHLG